MQDFINSVTEKLGISSENAGSATGGVLGMIKDNIPAGDFSELLQKLPGADALVSSAESGKEESGGGGLLGSVGEMASGLLGGDNPLDALSSLKNAGLDGEKGTSFVTMLIDYIKEKVGDEFLEKILAKVPFLKSLVG